jgi:hypothetical protein
VGTGKSHRERKTEREGVRVQLVQHSVYRGAHFGEMSPPVIKIR